MSADETTEQVYRIGRSATELLEALRPWTALPDSTRRLCVELTLALAAFSEDSDRGRVRNG